MTTKTKKRTVAKRTAKTQSKNVISVTTAEFAKQFYPNAQHPAKSLRARLRRQRERFADILVKSDAYEYAIPDTKTAREKFAAALA